VNDIAWLFAAMAVVWIGIGAYLFSLGARQRKLEERIESLDQGPSLGGTSALDRTPAHGGTVEKGS
jgi:CcmD family protein